MISVRPVRATDASAWLRMREALWPDGADQHAREIERYFAGELAEPLEVLVAADDCGDLIGFAELSIRRYVDGCDTDHVGFLEGWYVAPAWRRRGVGRALVAAAEDWARAQQCREFGSDALLENDVSASAHRALGFEETERVRYVRKFLSGAGDRIMPAAADRFLALAAGRRGHFSLESGHHGGVWLDLDALFADPHAVDPFVDTLAAQLRSYQLDAICGALVGGAFLAQLIARRLGVRFWYAEPVPSERTGALFQVEYHVPAAFVAPADGRVAIVDDVMSAGSALRGTYAALLARSTTPVVAGALLVLGTTGERFFEQCGVPVVAAARHEYELWTPSGCPLCAAGAPLEDPRVHPRRG